MFAQTEILHTATRMAKHLRPQAGPWMVTRPRLLGLLDRATRFPLTILVAPAGYGKTTLLSDWASRQQDPVAWYSLDATDNLLDQFLLAFVSTIRRRAPHVGGETLSLLRVGLEAHPRQLAAMLVDEMLDIDASIVVVLDDFHEVTDRDALEFMRAIIEMPPPCLRLVLASRSAPDLPVVALRARGWLVELGAQELAFTKPEGEQYLVDKAGLVPDDERIAMLVEAHHGWFAGLHMSAVATTMRVGDTESSDERAFRPSLEFLGQEVLDGQTDQMANFLIRIALPTRVSPELAEELAGEYMGPTPGRALLDRICDLGLFLTPLGPDHAWYRFHPLFRELLLSRLATVVGHEAIRDLNRRAASWFAAHGGLDEAIRHALAAEDADAASALVIDNAQSALIEDRWLELELWLAALPPERIRRDVDLLMARAWIGQVRGRHDVMRTAIIQVTHLLNESSVALTSPHVDMLRAELGLLEVVGIDDAGQLDTAIAASARAFETLRGTIRFAELISVLFYPIYLGLRDRQAATALVDGLIDSTSMDADRFARLRALWARTAETILAGRDGNVHTLAGLSRQVLAGAQQLGVPRLEAQGHFFLGSTLYETSDLTAAEHHLRAAATNPSAGILVLVGSITRLAACLNALGRRLEAFETVDVLLDRLLESEATTFVPPVRTAKALLSIAGGDLMSARALIDTVPFQGHGIDVRSVVAVPLIRALLGATAATPDGLAEADAILSALEETPESAHWFSTRIHARLIRALWHHGRGEDDRALALVDTALADAERTGHFRSIVDLGPGIASLLQWYVQAGGSCAHARTVLNACQADADRRRAPAPIAPAPRLQTVLTMPADVEPLTAREEDVLSCLQRRLSNKEIASELFISELTVKSHTRRIYGKLAVNTRRQAVERAIELGLLERPVAG